ncbi:hypothetical protein ACFQ0M_15860 [Kitasatospora aburaviensis]
MEQLYDEAEQASERFNAAQEAQQQLQHETGTLQQQVAVAQDELNQLRGDLATVAGAEYRGGGMAQTVQLMLATDPEGTWPRPAPSTRPPSGRARRCARWWPVSGDSTSAAPKPPPSSPSWNRPAAPSPRASSRSSSGWPRRSGC